MSNRQLSGVSVKTLFALACGKLDAAPQGAARSWQLSIGCMLGALVMAGVWGMLTGTDSVGHAARNGIAVPVVVLLSTLCALPAGLLGLKLSGAEYRARDLLLSFTSGLLGSTLIMAALAPLAGIYYHTSVEVGNHLAMVSIAVALLVGAGLFLRSALARAGKAVARRFVVVPSLVIVAIQLAALLQFTALAAPILPGGTMFDGGIDGLAL